MKFILSILSLVPMVAFGSTYKIVGDCGGYPKVDVKTAPGFCMGLVYDDSTRQSPGLKKFRWSAQVSDNLLVLSDLSSWGSLEGKIYTLDFKNKNAKLNVLFSKDSFDNNSSDERKEIIHAPNQLLVGPDKLVYVGTANAIIRFNPLAAIPKDTIEVVISKIPGGGLHSLKSFAFDDGGNIFVNVGSDSNVCQNFTRFADANNPQNPTQKQFDYCPEVENDVGGRAQIRKYERLPNGSYSTDFEIFARGLRNSIALAWDSSTQKLYQGENSRDAISKFSKYSNADFPNDELNIIAEGKHYGWPYCFGNNTNSPEWDNIDCSKYEMPKLLLPPHSAPLGLMVYKGSMFPSWYRGRLLSSLHGYEAAGHRIVAFEKDANGLPTGVPLSLVYEWEPKGEQEKGKPVGLTELNDGSVLIVEDDPQNKILRLFYDPNAGNGKAVREIDSPRPEDDLLSPAQE
ncbi:MAG: PQQ-dependent sugar dehydrogenase, partial [Bacteriovorax sp.]